MLQVGDYIGAEYQIMRILDLMEDSTEGWLLVSGLLLGKRIDRRQWLAMVVAYAGVLLVFLHDVRLEGQRAALGSSLVFMSAVAYALYLICSGEIVQRVGSLRLVAYASGGATVLCVLQAAWADVRPGYGLPADIDPLEGWIVSA